MITKAVRLYDKNDIRLESFELPPVGKDEILAQVISDSVCMSTYKTVKQGTEHKRVPADAPQNPVIIGHELCGIILEVGEKWQNIYKKGDKFAIQPVLEQNGSYDTIGYSFCTAGGSAEYILFNDRIISCGCLIPYTGENCFSASLAEPLSCIVGGYRAAYHSGKEEYTHEMGLKIGGKMAIIGGAGPMGLGAIDLALNGDRRPSLLVVTDVDQAKLSRAERLFSAAEAAEKGIKLIFINTANCDAEKELMALTDGKGFDDILCMAAVRSAVELSDKILARDACLNFFAGPLDKNFSATFNFYNVHYSGTHVTGTSGGTVEDLKIALDMISANRVHPEVMITHIGGLDAVIPTVLNLPSIPGGKKMIYPGITMPLTCIDDFAELGKDNELFAALAEICGRNNNLWNTEAEQYLLKYFNVIR